ncbi:hypothetical protein ACFE04_013139 [Oxalis oulophora]
MDGSQSQLDGYSSRPTQQLPSLDVNRAELSRRHVTALNTQFASWVQTQLKNHPDQLWEDGLRDYLSHASNIMEKFSDVVNWLKANAAKGESPPAERKSSPEVNNNEEKTIEEKSVFAPTGTAKSFNINPSFGTTSGFNVAPVSNFGPSFSTNSSFRASTTPSFGLTPSSTAAPSFGLTPVSTATTSFGLTSSSTATPTFGSTPSSNAAPSFGFTPSSGSAPSFGLTPSSGATTTSGTTSVFGTVPSFGMPSNTNSNASFAASWSSGGVFSNNQTPALFGNQNLAPINSNATVDEEEDEQQQPSSPSLKKSEEKGILVVHEIKCKLYVKSSDPKDMDAWKDKGTGQLTIKCKEGVEKGTKESKPTIVVRNDVGRLLLNASLYSGIKTSKQKNSLVAIFHTSADDGGSNDSIVARTFLIRTKTAEDRDNLATAIHEYAPSS